MQEILDRVKNILLHPKEEWGIIQHEHTSTRDLIVHYALPVAGVAALATFLGYGLFGINAEIVQIKGFDTGLILGINSLITNIATIIAGAYAIDALAPSFGAEKDIEKSMQLITYAYTPVMVGGILNIIPAISALGTLFGLYSIALLYWGILPLKKTPKSKHLTYLIISIAILILINFVIGYFLNGLFGSPYQLPA